MFQTSYKELLCSWGLRAFWSYRCVLEADINFKSLQSENCDQLQEPWGQFKNRLPPVFLAAGRDWLDPCREQFWSTCEVVISWLTARWVDAEPCEVNRTQWKFTGCRVIPDYREYTFKMWWGGNCCASRSVMRHCKIDFFLRGWRRVLEPVLSIHFISCSLVACGVVMETGCVFLCSGNVADGI